MPRASDRSANARETWLVALPLLLSVAALFLPVKRADALAALLRRSILAPLVWLQSDAVASRQTRARFNAIVSQRDSAVLAAQLLQSLKAENADLRGLLGLQRRMERGFRAAEVLHQQVPTDGRTLVLDAGSDAGLTEFAPVVAPGGLVGVLRQVGARTSVALTWAHPDWRASAVTVDGTAYGLVAPSAGASASEVGLEFRAISYRDTIPVGTLVVTSGLGGAYPQGIPVGRIVGISREQTGWERVYKLEPAANPSAVTHVLVLLGRAEGSLADVFPRPAPPKAAVPLAVPPDSARVPDAVPSVAERADSTARPAARDTNRLRRPASRDTLRPSSVPAEPVPTPPDSLR